MADAGNDKWLDLIERFAARGAEVSVGNLMPCFVKHLLDTVEEQDVRIRGLEDALLRRRPLEDEIMDALNPKKPDGE